MTARPHIQLTTIPSGYAGTMATVEHVIDLITRGAKDFDVRQTAIGILRRRDVRPKDYLGEIKALFEWVQRHVRYTRDPFRVEVLHSPRRMLELRAGDCDDMSILLGAMLEAIGHSVRLVADGIESARAGRVHAHLHRGPVPGALGAARRDDALSHGVGAARAGAKGDLAREADRRDDRATPSPTGVGTTCHAERARGSTARSIGSGRRAWSGCAIGA